MTDPIPSLKPVNHPQEFIDKLSSAKRMAAMWGVPAKYLHYADDSYTKNEAGESYEIYRYDNAQANVIGYGSFPYLYDKQFADAVAMLDSGVLWSSPPGLIIINTPYFLFDTECMTDFLSHVLCSLAFRITSRKAPNLAINFLETLDLDLRHHYFNHNPHLLIYGPIHDHFSYKEYSKVIKFLWQFRRYTRIILTCTADLGNLMHNLKVSPNYVTHLFNLNSNDELRGKMMTTTVKTTKRAIKKAQKLKETHEENKTISPQSDAEKTVAGMCKTDRLTEQDNQTESGVKTKKKTGSKSKRKIETNISI